MVALLHDSVPDLAHCLWPSVDQQQCLLVFPAVCPSVTYTTAARAAVRTVTEPFPRAVKYDLKKKKSKGIQIFSSNHWLHVQKEEAEFGRKHGESVPWWLLMMKQKCCISALCNISCRNMFKFPLYWSHQPSHWQHNGVAIYIRSQSKFSFCGFQQYLRLLVLTPTLSTYFL